jgi:uncharacterized membrane protein YgcG
MLKPTVFTGTIASLFFSQAAIAEIGYYRLPALSDIGHPLVIHGLNGATKLDLLYRLEKRSTVVVNPCGYIILRIKTAADQRILSDTAAGSSGLDVVPASYPTQPIARCDLATGTLAEARPDIYWTQALPGLSGADPTLLVAIKLPNAAQGTSHSVIYTSQAVRKVTINQCGFGIVKPSSKWKQDSTAQMKLLGQAIGIESLPQYNDVPQCRKSAVSGSYRIYYPADWLGAGAAGGSGSSGSGSSGSGSSGSGSSSSGGGS